MIKVHQSDGLIKGVNMKSLTKTGFLFGCFIFFVSCSNIQSGSSDSEPTTTTVQSGTSDSEPTTPIKVTKSEGMNYLGDVNKVFEASSSTRYVTGQIIENFCGHTVNFEGNLVEYNSIKQNILDYVESLESNNALMHQNYENVTYDSTKKYVEFSSYTDTTSGKIIRFEIRVFFGNFLDTYHTNYWYAKSVMFNSSFTKDMDKGTPVDFGEPLGTEDDEDTTTTIDPVIQQNQEDKVNLELINTIGTASAVYSAPNTTARFCTGQIVDWGGIKARFQGNLVAYSSVNSKITSVFDKLEFNAMNHQGYSNVSYDSTKTYIEVCYYENAETGDIINYELRLIDKSYFDGTHTGWYAKSYQFKTISDIQ